MEEEYNTDIVSLSLSDIGLNSKIRNIAMFCRINNSISYNILGVFMI
jgi:hypothetical protein